MTDRERFSQHLIDGHGWRQGDGLPVSFKWPDKVHAKDHSEGLLAPHDEADLDFVLVDDDPAGGAEVYARDHETPIDLQ